MILMEILVISLIWGGTRIFYLPSSYNLPVTSIHTIHAFHSMRFLSKDTQTSPTPLNVSGAEFLFWKYFSASHSYNSKPLVEVQLWFLQTNSLSIVLTCICLIEIMPTNLSKCGRVSCVLCWRGSWLVWKSLCIQWFIYCILTDHFAWKVIK